MARRIVAAFACALAAVAMSGARAEHIESVLRPGEPARQFPGTFIIPNDAQSSGELYSWSDPRMGGWGGDYPGAEPCPHDHTPRTPVVFVHGTSEDAPTAWSSGLDNGVTTVNVRRRFLEAGWCARELWAPSYTGARGYFTYNDANAEEVFAFVRSVLQYTGASQVDVVAHSLGVTVVRKAIRNHIAEDPSVSWLRRFVAIAGGNHGTTSCRGLGMSHGSHVCEELEPDGPAFTNEWLADLNGIGETPGDAGYLVLYDSVGDNFYQGPDAHSPRLDGACNVDLPGRLHIPLGRGPEAVTLYRAFLLDGTLPTCG